MEYAVEVTGERRVKVRPKQTLIGICKVACCNSRQIPLETDHASGYGVAEAALTLLDELSSTVHLLAIDIHQQLID